MLRYKKLHESAVAPSLASDLSAGYELCSCRSYTVPAGGGRTAVDTGLRLALPPGTWGRLVPVEILSMLYSVELASSVVEEDYRGRIVATLVNRGQHDLEIGPGQRVMRLLLHRRLTAFEPVEDPELEAVNCDRAGNWAVPTAPGLYLASRRPTKEPKPEYDPK